MIDNHLRLKPAPFGQEIVECYQYIFGICIRGFKMVLNRMSAVAKRALPSWVWSPARKLLTAFLTPIRFSLHTGHFRSSLRSAAVDRQGNPVPWYTYPAIDFLCAKDFSTKSVLEFGSGQSTLWWAKRTKRVVSLEYDPKWFAHVRSRLTTNAEVILISDDLTGLEDKLNDDKFDVIIVDGFHRDMAASRSIRLLREEGAILLDDSQGNWGRDPKKEYPILDLFRDAGFSRVDFYGYCPGVIAPHCTSLFFKERCFLIRGDENVVRDKLPQG